MWNILDWVEELEINFAATCIKTCIINHLTMKGNLISHYHFYQINSTQKDFEDVILHYVDFNELLKTEFTAN